MVFIALIMSYPMDGERYQQALALALHAGMYDTGPQKASSQIAESTLTGDASCIFLFLNTAGY